MKTVVNNLVWLALFAIMAAATIYPSVSPVSQSVIWLINGLLMLIAPLAITGACIEENKEKLAKLAGKQSGIIKKTFGLIKFALMFSAISYAGFSVAAVFYALGGFSIAVSVLIARDRLEKMD